jgi:hypothetical protein
MTPVNMVDDFCSFQKDNGGEKVYRPILCLLSTILKSSPASTRRKGWWREHMGSGMAAGAGWGRTWHMFFFLYAALRCTALGAALLC